MWCINLSDMANGQYLYDDKYYFDFERSFSHTDRIIAMARENYYIPICTVILYLLFVIVVGPALMRNRQPFKVKRWLCLWNGALSLFSFCGAIRTAPVLFYYITSAPMMDIICRPSDVWIGAGPTGLWVMLFIGSKFPELIDTIFLIVRKRDVPFLHWFHHASTLLYSWHACANPANYALSFVAMNYCVHAVMYAYYGLIMIGRKPAWLQPFFITISQITQMFVGMCIQITAAYWYFHPKQCSVSGYNILSGGVMYSTYLFLFIKFASSRYSTGEKTNKKIR